MFVLNEKAMHATKGLVRVMKIDGEKVTLRKSGIYFEDNLSKLREITSFEDAKELLINLESICNNKVETLSDDTTYYYKLARYGTLEDLFIIMKRFYLIRDKKVNFPLTPEESSIYAFAKDKALHEVSFIFQLPIEEIEDYVKEQLHYVKESKI
mgnify:CR=1 FL=1